MNFKPGDKVWITNDGGEFAAGTYAGVLIEPVTYPWYGPGWWMVDIDGLPAGTVAHEKKLRRRYDPPDWIKLCKLDEVRPSVPRELV